MYLKYNEPCRIIILYWGKRLKKIKKILTKELTYKVLFMAILFIICFCLSLRIHTHFAPDEPMKTLVVKYIFKYGKIPNGYDKSVLDPLWGTSYAFTPCIPYIFAGFFMKIASFFTSNSHKLLFSARFIDVLFYVGTIIFTMKIAKLLFEKNKMYKWLFIVLISCSPSVIYIGAYLNIDIMALFTISIIIYSWLLGIKNKWNWKSVISLGVGIGTCALSYYNSYGYILISVGVFIISYILLHSKEESKAILIKNILKKGISIIGIVLLISGWWFIRSYIIYNGDFLGLKSSDNCAEINAEDQFKPSIHVTQKMQKKTVIEMLFKEGWIKETSKTFILNYGYWKIYRSFIIYYLFLIIYLIAIIGLILYLINNIRKKYYKKDKCLLVLDISMLLSIIINVSLAIYYSYNSDYQPQGRYITPSLIPVTYFTVKGIKEVIENILKMKIFKNKEESEQIIIWTSVAILFILLLVYSIKVITVQ